MPMSKETRKLVMKFILSDKKERIFSLVFSAIIAAAMIALLIALWGNWGIFLLTLLGTALLLVFLVLYVRNVTRAACIYHPDTRIMEVKGLHDYEVDMSAATTLQTVPLRSGQATIRGLLFTDDEGRKVALVPTVFTSRQGIMTEPFAIGMAEKMGLKFQANVPLWEYNEEARIQHNKDVAAQEKADRKARREAKIIARRNKLYGKKKK